MAQFRRKVPPSVLRAGPIELHMQSLRSLLVPAVLTTWMCHASGLIAQDPTPQDPSANAPRTESPASQQPADQQPGASEARPRRRGGRAGLTVIEAGMVHPVSGPPIKNGVVLIRGERIFAIGQQGDLQLPPNSVVLKFPNGHVYPGLIDASTDAFTDAALQRDASLNGGSRIADGLAFTDSRDDHLIEHGVTTAYVHVHSGAQLPGMGAILRPRKAGFDLWDDKSEAALQLRMTTGAGASHPLQRQAQLEAVQKLFEGIDEYRDEQEKFEKDLATYNTDFEKYLEHHSKKNGKDKKDDDKKDDKAAPATTEETKAEAPQGGEGEAEGRRNGRRGSGRPPRRETPPGGGAPAASSEQQDAEALEQAVATVMTLLSSRNAPSDAAQDPQPKPGEAKPAPAKPQGAEAKTGGAEAAKKDDGPKRPTYPKKPTEDLQKEALAKVLNGDLPLRIEANREDELLAALRLQREKEIPLVVLEGAYGADRITAQIAELGATLVLTDVLPNSLGLPGDTRNPYAKFDPTALPHTLNEAGVPFAIAGGSARLSALLPMMAAAAIGRGLSEEAALRAITLTPAEILGIANDTGSLTRNKLADVIVTDGPLFASDSRVLLVVSKGRTEYEAK